MPDEAELVQLEIERSNGSKAQMSWDTFLGPFFEEKEKVFIEAFRNCEIRDDQGLMGIKLQFSAIDALKAELMGYIETGKMADISLNEIEATRKAAEEQKNG